MKSGTPRIVKIVFVEGTIKTISERHIQLVAEFGYKNETDSPMGTFQCTSWSDEVRDLLAKLISGIEEYVGSIVFTEQAKEQNEELKILFPDEFGDK